MAIDIQLLGPGDESVLENVAEDVFDHEVIPEQATRFLNDPAHYIAVAVADGVVVGMASANEYLHPDKPVMIWVNEMGVSPAWQRQGIGTRLLEALLTHARDNGFEEIWLGTENDNVPARGLYQSLGGKEEQFVMYTWELGAEGGQDS